MLYELGHKSGHQSGRYHKKHCKLTIVASVEPGAPECKGRLDRLEADIQNRFMTMDHHGGMNLREEIRRKRGMGQ